MHQLIIKNMSTHNIEKVLRNELESLNRLIDKKILKGASYTKEAREHKYLLARLIQMQKRLRPSFFSRLAFVPTLFL